MENLPGMQETFTTIFDGIWTVVEKVYRIFFEDLLPVIVAFYQFVAPIFPVIGTIIETAFNVVIKIIETTIGVFDDIIEAIKKVVGHIVEMIEKIRSAINWFKDLFKQSSKSKGVSVSGSPGLAEGGIVTSPGRVLVGEKGPELLDLPINAKVTPLKENDVSGFGTTINQNMTINSITPLSPSEIQKKGLDMSRQLALEWGL